MILNSNIHNVNNSVSLLSQVQQVLKAARVSVDLLVPQGPVDPADQEDPLDQQDHPVVRERGGHQDNRDQEDQGDLLDQPVSFHPSKNQHGVQTAVYID